MLMTLADFLPQTRRKSSQKAALESHSVAARLNIKFDAR
jgi:hypothetical protein